MEDKDEIVVALVRRIEGKGCHSAADDLIALSESNMCARRELGRLILDGLVPGYTYQEGIELVEECVNAGDAQAAYTLALELDAWGHFAAADVTPERVFALYLLAAQKGHSGALNNLGWCFQTGFGVEPDETRAHELWLEAAAGGDVDAFANLGRDYDLGMGVAADENLARVWYTRAANAGHAGATVRLAELALRDSSGGSRISSALTALETVWANEEAPKYDRASAAYNLALAYEEGRGVAVDLSRSHLLLRWAALAGLAAAQVDLGYLLYNGEGLAADPEEAVRLYRLAAAQGNTSGMYNLAIACEDGEGVGQDIEEALRWYQRAAELGHEGSRAALSRLDSESTR